MRWRMSVVLSRRKASVGRDMSGSGSGDARDTDTDTELGRDRAGGEVDAVMDGYRWGVAPVADEELPDLRTLVWKAAVSGSATLGPVDERGRKGSALGADWRPERLGRRPEVEADEEPRQRRSWSGDAGGEGSWRDLVSA